MNQPKLPTHIYEMAEQEIYGLDDLPDFAVNPIERRYSPEDLDHIMCDRLEDKDLYVKTVGEEEFTTDKSVKYWQWRIQPESIISKPKEFLHEGDKSLMIEDQGYGPEGAFFHTHPDKKVEFMGTKISCPEIILYGINEDDSKAYIMSFPVDEEESILYGSDENEYLMI